MVDQPPSISEPQDAPATVQRRPYRPYPGTLLFLIMPIAAALIAIVIAGPPASQNNTNDGQPPVVAITIVPLVNNPAPDFTLPMLDTSTVKLSSLKGQWVVVNFWATWCGPCRDEMPLLQELATGELSKAASVPGGVRVLAVNRDESTDAIKSFLADLKLSPTMPIALDSGAQVAIRYRVTAMPMTFFINPEGVIQYNQLGELTPKLLDCYLTRMAGGTCTSL